MAHSKDEADRLDKPVMPRFNTAQIAQIDRVRGKLTRATWIRRVVVAEIALRMAAE